MKKLITSVLLFYMIITSIGAGYVGTLPDVEAEFFYMRKDKTEKSSPPLSVEQLDEQNAKKLKPIPRNDDSYIDIIIKRDKTSDYTNDINSVIIILEKLRRCINTNQNIAMFNAIVSNLIDNIEYIHTEYKDKPESNYQSYNKLLELSIQARKTAIFRTKSAAIAKYIPYTTPDNIYTKENLEKQLQTLLKSVNDTIFILKNLE